MAVISYTPFRKLIRGYASAEGSIKVTMRWKEENRLQHWQ